VSAVEGLEVKAGNHVSADHAASRLTKMDDEILQPRSVAAA
jgi:hypothetical protein